MTSVLFFQILALILVATLASCVLIVLYFEKKREADITQNNIYGCCERGEHNLNIHVSK